MIACENKCGFEVKWSNEHGLKKHYSRSRCDPKNALIRKHVCHICQRTFSTESRKKKHEKYHFEEKPHKCLDCKATFMDSWGLKRHIGDKVCNSHLSLERQRRSIRGIIWLNLSRLKSMLSLRKWKNTNLLSSVAPTSWLRPLKKLNLYHMYVLTILFQPSIRPFLIFLRRCSFQWEASLQFEGWIYQKLKIISGVLKDSLQAC